MRLFLLLSVFLSGFSCADNIAFGKIESIKTYDFPSSKITKIVFSKASSHQQVESCNGVGVLTHSDHSDVFIRTSLSIAITAYTAEKKARAFSSKNTCEIDFIALQEKII